MLVDDSGCFLSKGNHLALLCLLMSKVYDKEVFDYISFMFTLGSLIIRIYR